MEELPNHPNLVDKIRWNISSDITAPIHYEKVNEDDIVLVTMVI